MKRKKRYKNVAPVQGGEPIPWQLHLEAWYKYAEKYGTSQSAEVIAERCGFHVSELDEYIPGWKDKVVNIEAENIHNEDIDNVMNLLLPYLEGTCYGIDDLGSFKIMNEKTKDSVNSCFEIISSVIENDVTNIVRTSRVSKLSKYIDLVIVLTPEQWSDIERCAKGEIETAEVFDGWGLYNDKCKDLLEIRNILINSTINI